MKKTSHHTSLVNVLGVLYLHSRTEDGGALYLSRFAEPYQEHLAVKNWYEESWFTQNRVRLLGTSSVYRVPTKPVNGTQLDLVIKNCRVGEDVPINTHTLEEFVNAEFNSPWEEFALVMEMGDKQVGQRLGWIRVLGDLLEVALDPFLAPFAYQIRASGVTDRLGEGVAPQ